MKKFSEAVLAPHKHMSKKASPYHAHSQGLVYSPSGETEVRPIDTADAGYGGEAVTDAEGGEADAGKASKKAVSPMKMQTLVKKTNEETERERLLRMRSFAYKQKLKGLGVDIHSPVNEEQIDELDSKTYQGYLAHPSRQHPKIKDVIAARNAERGGDEKPIERLAKTVQHRNHALRKLKDRYMKSQPAPEPGPIGSPFDEEVDLNELKKSTLRDYVKAATDDVSYHSFSAGELSSSDPERLVHDKKAMKRQAGVEKAVDKLAKEEVELDEISQEARKNKMRTMGVNAAIQYPKKVDFAGGAIQMYRKALKNLSSKEMGNVAKKLPSVKEQNDWNGPAEENDMAMTQLHFIKYAAEEIMEAIKVGTDMEEWYQNKLTKAHMIMESLHSYMEGRKRHHGSLGDPVSEGKAEVRADTHQAIKDFLAKGGKITKFAPSKATHRPGTALGSKHIGNMAQKPGLARNVGKGGKPLVAVEEGKMKDIATDKAEAERILGGPVKPKSSVVGGKGQPKNLRNLTTRLAARAMKAGGSVSEEVWDKPMPDSKKKGSLSPEQKAKAKARAERAGRSYPNMIDNMWASKQ